MSISVVVPTFNSGSTIGKCLESLVNQTRRVAEIIVVDDGSTDETCRVVSEYPVTLLRIPRSERSRARNVGWRSSKGEVVIFADSDCIYDRRYVEEMEKGFLQGIDCAQDHRRVHEPQSYVEKCQDFAFVIRYASGKDPTLRHRARAYRRITLEAVGGYDEELTIGEDTDLCTRVLAKGFRQALLKKAFEYHAGEPETFPALVGRSLRFERRKMMGYYKKHRGSLPLGKSLSPIAYAIASGLFLYFGLAWFALLQAVIFLSVYSLSFRQYAFTYGGKDMCPTRYIAGIPIVRMCVLLGGIIGLWAGAMDRLAGTGRG